MKLKPMKFPLKSVQPFLRSSETNSCLFALLFYYKYRTYFHMHQTKNCYCDTTIIHFHFIYLYVSVDIAFFHTDRYTTSRF